MTIVFLSYSHEDHFFADLAEIKLAESGIVIWRDHTRLRAGEEWRGGTAALRNETARASK
jgi:hypothetical protein